MAEPKQPVVGEKPSCPKHPGNFIDWTCSAGLCPFRVLCKKCLKEHASHFPHHQDQISELNKWYDQYKKLSKNFDPRESAQITYHVDEVEMILKKERHVLEKISKKIEENFEAALLKLYNKLVELKEYLQNYLWRDFNQVHDEYSNLVKQFSNLEKFNPKNNIFSTMSGDLQKHFSDKNLKEYFDKVYSGFYDQKVFNARLNADEMIMNLKEKRRMLEDGFSIFNETHFEEKWKKELDRFTESIKSACPDVIFQKAKLDFLNPKSPKLTSTKKPVSTAKVTCLSTLENGNFISKIDDGLYMTISENRMLNFLDPIQRFRTLKTQSLGKEVLTAIELLYLDPPDNCKIDPPLRNCLLLLGGDDESPSLEVWDCLRLKCLTSLENVHEFKISSFNMLKKEKCGLKETFFVASGSCDDYIKLWQIDVLKEHNANTGWEYKIEINMLIRKKAHDSFISSLVSVPASKNFPTGILMSCSQDKSIYFWGWERELQGLKCKENSNMIQENGYTEDHMYLDHKNEENEEKYGKKNKHAHTDRIHELVLIHEKDDYSDLEHYASGGGDE